MSKFLITLSNLLALASLCIVFSFFFGTLITSNNSFCLIFCFLLGCSCMLRCVVFVFFVYRFAFYSKLFTWAISCFCLFVIICFLLLGSECKNRKRPLNVFLIQMICMFCTRFASCFISNYSFLLDQLLLVVLCVFALLRFAAQVVLLIFRADIFVIFSFS